MDGQLTNKTTFYDIIITKQCGGIIMHDWLYSFGIWGIVASLGLFLMFLYIKSLDNKSSVRKFIFAWLFFTFKCSIDIFSFHVSFSGIPFISLFLIFMFYFLIFDGLCDFFDIKKFKTGISPVIFVLIWLILSFIYRIPYFLTSGLVHLMSCIFCLLNSYILAKYLDKGKFEKKLLQLFFILLFFFNLSFVFWVDGFSLWSGIIVLFCGLVNFAVGIVMFIVFMNKVISANAGSSENFIKLFTQSSIPFLIVKGKNNEIYDANNAAEIFLGVGREILKTMTLGDAENEYRQRTKNQDDLFEDCISVWYNDQRMEVVSLKNQSFFHPDYSGISSQQDHPVVNEDTIEKSVQLEQDRQVSMKAESILTMADLLGRTLNDGEQSEYIVRIEESAREILACKNEMYRQACEKTKNDRQIKTRFNLKNLLDGAYRQFAENAENKDISTSIEFLEVEQDSIYEGDPVKLRLLLSCVLEKLLFYTESNELSIKAQKIYHDRENSYFVFSITEGRYIQSPANDEADHRTNVRDCFSECLDLASQAGGKIWTEKTDGLRKYEITFVLGNTFPVSQAESLSVESFQDKLNILVVEDNEINQKLICAILKKRGWNPLVADNGLKALEVLKDKSFDIILMDVQMPYMDGYETTRRIRQSENQTVAKIPIVAMTAYAMTEYRQSCIKSGMNDYITKPVNMSDLYTIIERNLSKR